MTAKLKEKKTPSSSLFSPLVQQEVDWNRIPKSVAVIMDGNRRWAAMHHLPTQIAHVKGAENLKKIVQAAIEVGIKTLTVFAFSTENKHRSQKEVNSLLELFKNYLIEETEDLVQNGVRLHSIGDTKAFPKDIQKALEDAKHRSQKEDRLDLVLALNYGARDEIKRAAVNIAKDCLSGKMSPDDISEEVISQYLDTAPFPDPELVIRTSGESRLSNFLLWQISYSEIYLSKEFWPSFGPNDLLHAIKQYQQREIRRGI